jgi:GAF domain-containing protein
LSNNELNDFRVILRDGIPAGLRYLNARTPHRFTGIFKYDGSNLRNLFLIDREVREAQPWSTFPVSDSFCAIVRDTGAPFVTGEAPMDDRLRDHPARDKIISYCGVPLRTESGDLYGSLCHFDYKPIHFSDLDLDFAAAAAPLLMKELADLQ